MILTIQIHNPMKMKSNKEFLKQKNFQSAKLSGNLIDSFHYICLFKPFNLSSKERENLIKKKKKNVEYEF